MKDTIDDWRKGHLRRLNSLASEGCDKFEWVTANDDVVCALCAAREGRVFSAAELRRELSGAFCCPGDSDDRCRCVVVSGEDFDSFEDGIPRSSGAQKYLLPAIVGGALVLLAAYLVFGT